METRQVTRWSLSHGLSATDVRQGQVGRPYRRTDHVLADAESSLSSLSANRTG